MNFVKGKNPESLPDFFIYSLVGGSLTSYSSKQEENMFLLICYFIFQAYMKVSLYSMTGII